MSPGCGYYDKYHGIHFQITASASDGSGHLADEAARRLAADCAEIARLVEMSSLGPATDVDPHLNGQALDGVENTKCLVMRGGPKHNTAHHSRGARPRSPASLATSAPISQRSTVWLARHLVASTSPSPCAVLDLHHWLVNDYRGNASIHEVILCISMQMKTAVD